jgi:hypothetical protein
MAPPPPCRDFSTFHRASTLLPGNTRQNRLGGPRNDARRDPLPDPLPAALAFNSGQACRPATVGFRTGPTVLPLESLDAPVRARRPGFQTTARNSASCTAIAAGYVGRSRRRPSARRPDRLAAGRRRTRSRRPPRPIFARPFPLCPTVLTFPPDALTIGHALPFLHRPLALAMVPIRIDGTPRPRHDCTAPG